MTHLEAGQGLGVEGFQPPAALGTVGVHCWDLHIMGILALAMSLSWQTNLGPWDQDTL